MMTKKEIEAAGKEEYALWRNSKDRVNSIYNFMAANANAHIDRLDKAVTSGDPEDMLEVFGPGGGIAGLTKKASNKALKAWEKKDKEAQAEAVKRLGLPKNNTAKDRAKAMGFGDDVYHGTRSDFDNFSLDEASKHKAIYTTPDTTVADNFASNDFYSGYRVGPSRVLPLKTRGNLFDYDNPEHIKRLENEIGAYEYDLSKGHYPFLEDKSVQDGIRKLGFDGFNTKELDVKNTGIYNPANIRSKFAHFNPKLAGIGGAGAILSADLMAKEIEKTGEQEYAKWRADRNKLDILQLIEDAR